MKFKIGDVVGLKRRSKIIAPNTLFRVIDIDHGYVVVPRDNPQGEQRVFQANSLELFEEG